MLHSVRLLPALLCLPILAALATGASAQTQTQAQDATAWHVSKSSGSVWVMSAGAQPASLGSATELKPGDSIRTGNNGRVLLERGKETILVAPNSALTIPATQKDAASTTIIQQSGSIRLEVEKRNVRSFEVETPYLVAAVKGTQFTVTVGQGNASVQVDGGSVEVLDVKTGDFALVAPGQAAKVSGQGNGGLTLSGTGTFSPIQHGPPRPTSVQPLPVPRNGLTPPRDAPAWHHVRTQGSPIGGAPGGRLANQDGGNHHGYTRGPGGVIHIGSPLGEIRLDIHRVTGGLARDTASARSGPIKQSIWSTGETTPGNGVAKNYSQGNNGSGSGAGSANGTGSGNGGGNGNNGNGNGDNGSSNGLSNGLGNVNAQGNGANNTNGNGKKNGHTKG
jgi:hypothetical protein